MSVAAVMSKKVGPMPMGVWLLVGAGGLFIAYRSKATPAPPVAATTAADALPTGGGYGPQNTGSASWDGAPVVLSPIFQVPVNDTLPNPAPIVNVFAPPPATPSAPSPAAAALVPRPFIYGAPASSGYGVNDPTAPAAVIFQGVDGVINHFAAPAQSAPYANGQLLLSDPKNPQLGTYQTADTPANRAMAAAEDIRIMGGY